MYCHTAMAFTSLLASCFFFKFFYLFIFIYYLLVYYVFSVLPACIPAGQKRAPNLLTDGCEHMWWLGIEPLEEQANLLTTEPTLQLRPSTGF